MSAPNGHKRRLQPERGGWIDTGPGCNPAPAGEQSVDEFIDLAHALLTKARALEAFLRRSDSLVDLLEIDVDTSGAGGAYLARIGAKPSQLCLELIPALRAADLNLLVVEAHLGPLVGLATTSGALPAGDNNVAGGEGAG